MFARVSRYDVPADKLDADVQGVQETQQKVSQMPGSQGLLYFVDRQNHRTMAVTLWEDERAMWESEDAASKLRDETTAANSGTVISVERYEVATQPAMMGSAMR